MEVGLPSLDFEVPPGLQLSDATDIDGDGLDELVAEWHVLPTPQIHEGKRSIFGFAGGVMRELFHGRFAQSLSLGSCATAEPSYDTVSITVSKQGVLLHFDESLWRQPCNPKQPNEDVGPPVLIEYAASDIDPQAIAAEPTPTVMATIAPRAPHLSPAPERDAYGNIIRKPAATPLGAACHGPSKACQCPDFSGFPEGKGRATLLRQGSFSGPYPEALVEVMMCEGHANNWGGTVLVRKLDVGWLPIGYVVGFVPHSCSAHRGADGLERLACLEGYGLNQGTYSTSASVVDFAAKHYDVPSEAVREDARDVKGVRWLSSIPADQDVSS